MRPLSLRNAFKSKPMKRFLNRNTHIVQLCIIIIITTHSQSAPLTNNNSSYCSTFHCCVVVTKRRNARTETTQNDGTVLLLSLTKYIDEHTFHRQSNRVPAMYYISGFFVALPATCRDMPRHMPRHAPLHMPWHVAGSATKNSNTM